MEQKVDFHSLTRRQLQTLCKQYKIPANMTNVAMAGALDDLLNKEDGCEVNVAELLVTPCKTAPDTPLVTPGRLTRSQVKKQLQESATKREPQQKKLLFDSEAVSVKNDESVKVLPRSTKKPPVRRSVAEVKGNEQQKLSQISDGEGSVVWSESTAKSSQVRRIAIADEKKTEEAFQSEVFSSVSSGDANDGWEISKVQVVSSEVTVADDKVEVAEKESKISVSAVESGEDGAKAAAVPVVADVIPDEHGESEASAKSALTVEDGESEASAKASALVADVISKEDVESGASAKVSPVPVAAVIPEEDGELEASAKVASVPVIILEEDGELEASAKVAPVPMVAEVIVEECSVSEAFANASPVPEGIPGASNEDERENASGSGEVNTEMNENEDRVPEIDAECEKVTGMDGAEKLAVDDEQSEESEYSPEDGSEFGQDMEGGSEYEGSESDDEDHIPSSDEAVADFNTKLNEDLVPDDECEKVTGMCGVDGEQKEESEYTSEDGYSTEVESDEGSESDDEDGILSESDDEDYIKSHSDEEGLMKEMHSDQKCEVKNEEDDTSVDRLTSAKEVYNQQHNDIVKGECSAEDGLAEAVKSTDEALLTVTSSGEDAKTSLAEAGFLDDQLVLRAQVSDLAADAWDEADDIYFVEDQYRDETKEADPAFVLEVEQLSQALSEVSICDNTEVAEVQNQNEQEKEVVVDDKSMKRAEDDDQLAVEAEVADDNNVSTESELQPPSSKDVEVVNEEAKFEDDHCVIVNELPEAEAFLPSLEVTEEIREAVARIDCSASNPSKKKAAKPGCDKENLVGFGKFSLRQLKKIHKTKLELRKEKAPSARARLQESSKSAVLSPNVRKNNCAH